MKTIEIVPENLYRIRIFNEQTGSEYNKIVNKNSLDYAINRWADTTWKVIIEEELGPISFEGVTLETEGPRKAGRCYHVQKYKLTSPKPLDEFSFEALRAYKLFMSGQREGFLVGKEKVRDNYVYNLISECDSSD